MNCTRTFSHDVSVVRFLLSSIFFYFILLIILLLSSCDYILAFPFPSCVSWKLINSIKPNEHLIWHLSIQTIFHCSWNPFNVFFSGSFLKRTHHALKLIYLLSFSPIPGWAGPGGISLPIQWQICTLIIPALILSGQTMAVVGLTVLYSVVLILFSFDKLLN